MSTIRANSITNSAGTGAPDFPNGLTAATIPAANLTGTLPAINGSALTNLPGSVTHLGTIATTSGSSQTLSGLSLGSYNFLVLAVNRVSVVNTGRIDLNGIRVTSDVATTSGLTGLIQIDLATGVGTAMTVELLVSGTPPLTATSSTLYGFLSTITTATTSITVASGNTFDAGSIRVYGVK